MTEKKGDEGGWAEVVGDLEPPRAGPLGTSLTPGPRARPSLEAPGEPPQARPPLPLPFSPQALLQELEAPPPAPPAQAGLHPKSRRAAWTVAGGALVLGAAIALGQATQAPPEAPRARPDPRGAPRARPAPAPAPEPSPPTPVAPPMLSVLSVPSGALVQVGAVILGRTPLVVPAPAGGRLEVTLILDGHRRWSRQVRPDSAGHYTVHAELQPRDP